MDYGTSGKYSLLFPRDETGRENRIESGKEYRIPATEAWFRIDGPPGHDIVYWLVSPLPLASRRNGVPPLPKTEGAAEDPAAALRRFHFPRPRPVHRFERRPARHSRDRGTSRESEGRAARPKSRELIIMRKEEQSLISSPVPLAGPVVYEFRLAHK